MDIYCLMVSSVSLDNNMRNALFEAACIMVKKNSPRMDVGGSNFEGVVYTAFETKTLSSLAGIEFLAEIATELGQGKIKFLVRESEIEVALDDLAWISFSSIHEVDAVLDPPPSRFNPAYN